MATNKKVAGVLSTTIELDGTKATQSLKQLKGAVSQTAREYKMLEAQAKSSGDELKASGLRVEGLTKALSKGDEQIKATKAQMANLNTSTEKGQQAYSKLSQELLKAESKQSSMNAQLRKAQEYNSKLADGTTELNRTIENRNRLTSATVERLQAEGRAEEASATKAKALVANKKDLNDLLEKESIRLNKVADASGKTGREYTDQAVKVEKLRGQLAKTNTQLNELGGNHKPIKTISDLRERVSSVGKEGTKVHAILGGMIGGGLTTLGVSALDKLKEGLSSIYEKGSEFNKEQQVMTANWTTLTSSATKSKAMVDSINSMSTAFGQSADLVNELDQQFFHVFNNKKETEELTKSVLTMGDTIGMSSEDVKRLGLNFTHMMTSGKMQLGDFNMITDQLPMYGEKLLEYEKKVQHNSKLTMAELRKQMSAGKISSDDAQAVMNELGTKYKSASENMMKTSAGATRQIESQVTKLSGALIAPFSKVQNPFLGAIAKWSGDKRTEKEFGKLGKSASKGLTTITNAFAKALNVKNVPKSADKMLKNLTNGVQDLSSYIAKHAKSITNFFSGLGSTLKILATIGIGAFKTLAGALTLITAPIGKLGNSNKKVGGLSNNLKALTKHTTALKVLGGVLGSLYVGMKVFNGAKKIIEFAKALRLFTVAQWAMNVAMDANPIGLAVTAIGLLVIGIGVAYAKIKPFRDFINGLASAIGKNFSRQIKRTVKAFKGFVKGAKELWDNTKEAFSNGWKATKKVFGNFTKGIKNGFNSAKKGAVKHAKQLWSSTKDSFINGNKTLTAITNTTSDMLHGKWGNIKKDVTGIGRALFNTIKSVAKTGYNVLNSMTGGGLAKVTGGWKGFSKGIQSIFSSLWKTIKSLASGGINGLIDIVNAGIKGIDSLIHTFGGKKQTISPIGKVKFATGTGALGGARRAINSLTHAVLNDGNDSPETGNKEMLIHPNGGMSLVQGRNTEMLLPAGTEVLNATETKMLMGMQGIQHFASGTGFFSKLWKGITSTVSSVADKVKTFSSMIAHPVKTFNGMFKDTTSGSGVMANITSGIGGKAVDQAKSWFTELMNMFSSSADSGSGSSSDVVNYAKKEFGDAKYVFGSLKKTALDCSGMVKLALAHFGIDVPHQSQEILKSSKLEKISKSEAKAGDIVGWGIGHSPTGHIGFLESGDKFYSAMSPDSKPNVKTASIAGMSKLDPFKGYYRVKGLKDSSSDDDKSSVKASGSLQKSIKNLVGDGVFKWIEKYVAPILGNDGGGGDQGAQSVKSWTDDVKKALKMNGLSTSDAMVNKVLRQIKTESGGDASATQHGYTDINTLTGNLAQGLMQVIPPTFNAYKFKGHGNIKNGLDNLLAALNYAKHRYGKNLSGLGNGHGYADGGLISQQQIATLGENNQPEMVIPLSKMKTSRALELLAQATTVIGANAGVDTTKASGQVSGLDDSKLDVMISLLSQLVQGQSNPVPAVISSNDVYNANKKEANKRNTANLMARGV